MTVEIQESSAPVIFLLGAGASVPLGMPTTDQLRAQLCDETELGMLASEIHRSAAYRFRIGEDDVNIETFLEHLYEIKLLIWLAQRSNLPTLIPNFTADARVVANANESLADVEARVFGLVRESCGDCDAPSAEMLWSEVLQIVARRQAAVPVFTLNYDWTFERLAIDFPSKYELVDGFELLGGVWDPARFTSVPVAGKTNIRLFKLHGSTNWVGEGPIKSLASFHRQNPNEDDSGPGFVMIPPGHAHEISLGDEYWQQPLRDGGPPPWLGSEPFKTLHETFASAACNARLIVVIGYAFHDETVNRSLESALAANKQTKVLVVDPGTRYSQAPFDWLKFALYEIDWSRFYWFQDRFSPESSVEVANAIEKLCPEG